MPKKSTLKPVASDATSASAQDYLAAIYDLQSSRRPVIGARLAKHMAVSAPAMGFPSRRRTITQGGSLLAPIR